MNFLASAIAAEYQWTWALVGMGSLISGAACWKAYSLKRGFLVAGIQGTLLSLFLLGLAPTTVERNHEIEAKITEYAELLDSRVIGLYPESREADIMTPEYGALSVRLESDHLVILNGEHSGSIWGYDSLVRSNRLEQAELAGEAR